MSQNKNRVIPV